MSIAGLTAALGFVVLPVTTAQAATTLSAQWRQEDPTTMIDSSGNGNTGTPTAITSVAGTTGMGYHFNGTNSAVRVASAASLNPGTADFTLAMQVRTTTVPSAAVGDYDLIRKGIAGTPGGEFKMEIIANPTRTEGRAFCLVQVINGTNRVTVSVRGTTNVSDGVWHAMSCVKTATTLQIIVDGVANSTSAQLGSISNTERLVLGGKDLGGDQYLGDMDEVTVSVGTSTSDTTPPSVPTNLTATPTGTQVALNWTASTDNVGVTGYILRRDGVQIASPTTTTYPDNGLTPGQTYSYTVEAFDAATNVFGQSTPVTATVPTTADVTPPSVPTGLTATPSAAQVALSWTASTDNIGVTGYILRRDGTTIATPTTTGYTDTAVTAGQTYSYTVEALDAANNASGQSTPATATVPTPAGIALRGSTAAANSATKTLVVPAPTNQAGDLLLATVDFRNMPTVTAPAGWQLLRKDINGTAMTKATYWRIAGATEPTSYTWTLSTNQAAVGEILAYSGVSTTAPIQASAGQITTTNSTSITAPSITTTTPNAVVVGLFGQARSCTIAQPAGMTERTEITSPSGLTYQVTGETADQLQAVAGATGSRLATSTVSGPSIGHVIALTPGS